MPIESHRLGPALRLLLLTSDVDLAQLGYGLTSPQMDEALPLGPFEVVWLPSLSAADHFLSDSHSSAISAICADCVLPDGDGLSVVAHLTAVAPHLPLLLVGPDEPSLAERALLAGVQEVLVKAELTPARLARAVHHSIQRYSLVRRQTALARVELPSGQALDLERLLHSVVAVVTRLLPATGGASIVLWDATRGRATVSASTVADQPVQSAARRIRRQGGATRWIIDHGQPVIVSDVQMDPFGANSMLAEYQLQAYAGMPLQVEGKTIGVLYALDHAPRHYSSADLEFLAALADRAANAIARAQLLEAEQQQRALADALRRISAVISSSLALDEVLEHVLDSLAQVIPYDSAAVTLLEGEHRRVYAGRGFPPDVSVGSLEVPVAGDQLFAAIQTSSRPLVIRDVAEEPGFRPVPALAYIRARIAVPMLRHGTLIGLLTVDSRSPDAYTEREAEVAFAFADHAAIAIENARLFAETQNALVRVAALYDTTRRLIEMSSLTELLSTVVESVAGVLHADRVVFITLDLPSRKVDHFVAGGPGAAQVRKVHFAELWAGLTGWVIRNNRPALSPKGTADQRESARVQSRRRSTAVGSVIVAPVRYQEQILGTMTALNRPEQADFDEEDLELLQALAHQVAVAVQSARLFEEVERLARTDTLTGLTNRRRLVELGERLLEEARQSGWTVAAALLDVDHFKHVNDFYGHAAGDLALQEVARLCQRNVHATDIVARYGGEEFAIIMPRTNAQSAHRALERLRLLLAGHAIALGDTEISLTFSAGVVDSRRVRGDLAALLQAADAALYLAKARGRNRVEIWQGTGLGQQAKT